MTIMLCFHVCMQAPSSFSQGSPDWGAQPAVGARLMRSAVVADLNFATMTALRTSLLPGLSGSLPVGGAAGLAAAA